MVGLDHYWDIVIGNRIRDTQKLLALIRTKLAYILSGPVYTEIHRNNSVATFFADVVLNQEESIKEELHKFWSLESLGTIDNETVEEFLRKMGEMGDMAVTLQRSASTSL